MPKGEAKRRGFGIRLTDEDLKNLTAAVKARKQTVTEFIQGTLSASMEA
ncbi:hypothetical protein ACPOL_6246 [Acidisarcina polymorpha]|uniref:Ribbon-helix-helix protein CopG domain-containing protein n=2 Tax=Acidobacteriaceae TaxID=204434 RepID=A0A4Q0SXD8_9BACT|nr:hypothetical protein ACPOL_6246 [Acidisarcina polymorpha]RXH53821.1 hypothetical protein GRAN_5159 [Granulicella sibirica]